MGSFQKKGVLERTPGDTEEEKVATFAESMGASRVYECSPATPMYNDQPAHDLFVPESLEEEQGFLNSGAIQNRRLIYERE
jgi:hypothetical protein